MLGIKREFKKRKEKTEGLKATKPNQYLHVDTTYWILKNGMKKAIVFVSDNYSRAILGWSIGEKNCAENVKVALNMTIQSIKKHYIDFLCSTIITDGGGENHGTVVEDLIKQTNDPDFKKEIAQKDITHSNSPIEAINKIVKRYLREYDPQTDPQLLECIKHAVKDYTEKRPHVSLKGLIPMEVYSGNIPKLNFSKEIEHAKARRIEENQHSNCPECENL